MGTIEYPANYYTNGSGNLLWFVLTYHTGWLKFDIQADSSLEMFLISGVNNVLVRAKENDILKSRHGSKQRFGALCEKGNFVLLSVITFDS